MNLKKTLFTMLAAAAAVAAPLGAGAATVVFQFQTPFGSKAMPAVSLTPLSVPLQQSNAIVLGGMATFRWPSNGLAVDTWGNTNAYGWFSNRLYLPLSAGSYQVQVAGWPRPWTLVAPDSTGTFFSTDLSSNLLILTPAAVIGGGGSVDGVITNGASNSSLQNLAITNGPLLMDNTSYIEWASGLAAIYADGGFNLGDTNATALTLSPTLGSIDQYGFMTIHGQIQGPGVIWDIDYNGSASFYSITGPSHAFDINGYGQAHFDSVSQATGSAWSIGQTGDIVSNGKHQGTSFALSRSGVVKAMIDTNGNFNTVSNASANRLTVTNAANFLGSVSVTGNQTNTGTMYASGGLTVSGGNVTSTNVSIGLWGINLASDGSLLFAWNGTTPYTWNTNGTLNASVSAASLTSGTNTANVRFGSIGGNGAGITNLTGTSIVQVQSSLAAVPTSIALASGSGSFIKSVTNASFTIASFVPVSGSFSSAYLEVSNSAATSITATISAAYRAFNSGTTNSLTIGAGKMAWFYTESFGFGSTNHSNTYQP